MAARAREEGNDKLEANALRLAKDTVKEITNIVTDNESLIDAAYEAAYKQDDEERQQRQMNNSKESQEDYRRKEPIV